MFCNTCGQAIQEGGRFCKNCGAPAPQVFQTASGGSGSFGPGAAGTADLDATAVRPPADGTGDQAPGWQPPPGPGKQRRTGLIVGSVAAGIIILAGLGVGLYFGLRDGGGPAATGAVAAASTEATGVGITGGGTSTTVPGSNTTGTLPDSTSTTSSVTTTTAPAATTTTVDPLGPWYAVYGELLVVLTDCDARIPELAEAINSTAPDVPGMVYDELAGMMDRLALQGQSMAETPIPDGHEDPHYWLMQAVTHMSKRIQATMDGIAVMWDTRSVDAAKADFDEGRAERDAYREAMSNHLDALPSG